MPHASAIAVQTASWGPADLRAIYDQHVGFLRALLMRLLDSEAEAEDVLQDVFVAAWQKCQQLRGSDVRPWLCGIAVKLAARARRRRRLVTALGRVLALERVEPRTPEQLYAANEAGRVLKAALDQISTKKRTVFVLFELQGLSGQEIAAALGIPLKTVWSRLGHARRELTALLEERGFSPAAGGGWRRERSGAGSGKEGMR